MRNILLILALLFFLLSKLNAQAPSIIWQKCLGGSADDVANAIQAVPDGFIVAGYSNSNNDDVSNNHGSGDFWITKLNTQGNIQWQRSLGGTNLDVANSIQAMADGGYIVVGESYSSDGDIPLNCNHGEVDMWVVRLSSAGAIQGQYCIGGVGFDHAYCVQTTPDGGFIVSGDGPTVNGNGTGSDCLLTKFDANIIPQGFALIGGTGYDGANAIRNTSDGGYIIAGVSTSNNGPFSTNHGNGDILVAKLDANGVVQWLKLLGGSESDAVHDIQTTADGGYIVAGETRSKDGNVLYNQGHEDYWVIKLSSSGTIQWQRTLGGSGRDWAYSIQQTPEGGYIVAGSSYSNDGDVSGNHGGFDAWLVKLSPTGLIQWEKSFGGSFDDGAKAIIANSDGTYTLAGFSESNDNDVSGNHGDKDFWIAKLADIPVNDAVCSSILIPSDGSVQSGFTNRYATVSAGESILAPVPNDCLNSWCESGGNAITNSVWFSFIAPSTGAVEVSTCGMADFDTQIAVYRLGTICNTNYPGYIRLAANDDDPDCQNFSSKLEVGGLTQGVSYYILLDGYDGETGDFSIKVTPITLSATHEVLANSPMLSTYPNPSSGLLTISLQDDQMLDAYTLCDLTGKVVVDVKMEQALGQTEADLSSLPKGLYMLQVRSGDRVFSEKIILQ